MSDPRNFLSFPAPLWRRLAAAMYDALLLTGVWMAATMIYVPVRDALGGDGRNAGLPALLFLAGAGFFGWSWTHGGRTLGMLAWHLQVRRADADALRWPVALSRYAVMLATWALSLLPLILLLPQHLLQHIPHPLATAMFATVLTLAALIGTVRDGRHRAPCDRLTGTEVVVLPKRR